MRRSVWNAGNWERVHVEPSTKLERHGVHALDVGGALAVCGLAAGITALIAVTRRHERSWLVWLTLLPGLLVGFLILGELLVPH